MRLQLCTSGCSCDLWRAENERISCENKDLATERNKARVALNALASEQRQRVMGDVVMRNQKNLQQSRADEQLSQNEISNLRKQLRRAAEIEQVCESTERGHPSHSTYSLAALPANQSLPVNYDWAHSFIGAVNCWLTLALLA